MFRWHWLGLILLLGCHYAGRGLGELRAPVDASRMEPKGRVTITWQSEGDAASGTMEAAFPDGRRFTGHFVQPRKSSWYSDYGGFGGWGNYGASWYGPWAGGARGGPWYGGPRSSMAQHHADAALAHLESADGTRMRCTFVLYDPDRGLAGGAQGDCELSTSEDVFDAVLQPAR